MIELNNLLSRLLKLTTIFLSHLKLFLLAIWRMILTFIKFIKFQGIPDFLLVVHRNFLLDKNFEAKILPINRTNKNREKVEQNCSTETEVRNTLRMSDRLQDQEQVSPGETFFLFFQFF